MRKPARLHNGKKLQIRQSWHKYNLTYLLLGGGKWVPPKAKTVFQQQWNAKARTRAYYGEHVPETHFKRMFSKRLLGAVEMPAEYLARHDGSEQAAGRGSGLRNRSVTAKTFSRTRPIVSKLDDRSLATKPVHLRTALMMQKPLGNITPYVNMAFAPLERRLDTAIFRALFASSARQARQFVIHGAVKVNGKKITHPSYLLNPGDMFQVDPERVLYATGRQAKDGWQEAQLRQVANSAGKALSDIMALRDQHLLKQRVSNFKRSLKKTQLSEDEIAKRIEQIKLSAKADKSSALSARASWQAQEKLFKRALNFVAPLLKDRPWADRLTQEQAYAVQAFRYLFSGAQGEKVQEKLDADDIIKALEQHSRNDDLRELYWFTEITKGVVKRHMPGKTVEAVVNEGEDGQATTNKSDLLWKGPVKDLPPQFKELKEGWLKPAKISHEEARYLKDLLNANDENPVDVEKPYATPWMPRPYIAPFCFIPRYLEVNQNVCAAVYLRHPVAKTGLAEVPSPFSYFINQLAYSWYVRRT